MTIYVPSEYKDNCNVVYNDYIRSYTNSNRTQWTDIYINQDYMLKDGNTNYSQNVVCDTKNTYTDDIYYRVDFDKILIIFILLVLVCIITPYKIFRRLWRSL